MGFIDISFPFKENSQFIELIVTTTQQKKIK